MPLKNGIHPRIRKSEKMVSGLRRNDGEKAVMLLHFCHTFYLGGAKSEVPAVIKLSSSSELFRKRGSALVILRKYPVETVFCIL